MSAALEHACFATLEGAPPGDALEEDVYDAFSEGPLNAEV
jgi:hypothetical protein